MFLGGKTNMTTIARLVTRSARADDKVDLIIGAATKGETELTPNTIYEIRECMGELTIVRIGPSAIKNPGEKSPVMTNWGHSVSEILDCSNNVYLLTEGEAKCVSNKKF